MPTETASGEVGTEFGSYNFIQPYFDINQPLNREGTVLFRMTGEYTKSASYVDEIETKRYSLNPTLTFTNKTDTSLTVQAKVSDWEQQDYQGLPRWAQSGQLPDQPQSVYRPIQYARFPIRGSRTSL